MSAPVEARFRSWVCHVAHFDDQAPGGGTCVELIWRISGISPRVFLCGNLTDRDRPAAERDISPAGSLDEFVIGPSGHRCARSIDNDCAEAIRTAIDDANEEAGSDVRVRMIMVGTDADSSPAIARRAADLLARVLIGRSKAVDGPTLDALLAERAVRWEAWGGS